ncbi:MAG: RNA-dependent polymerase [Defluviitaleaceae bacterium]|jgi:retron-type reverse transcriptase|nr:RNA-dependent polymerase [Defluviitaleaceae bacterium]
MKYIKNLYDDICTFENLYLAYKNARKNKRFRDEVLEFSSNVEEYLMDIRKELIEQTYKVGKYREFFVYEPKKRLIMALPFKDRVVQWAIYQKLNPYFTKGYISDSFACIEGRGAHQAVQRLHYWLRQIGRKPGKYYYLKLDISKYYYRIDHDVLVEILSRKIKDTKLMKLLEGIIRCEDHSFGLPLDASLEETDVRINNKGMPIGNLTSQMFANIYLNELDQYVKRKLRIHYYVRYMDDVIILHESKQELHKIKKVIETFLDEKLKLNLNNKTAIRPVTLGIEFVGYKVWNTHIKLRKSTALKMKRRLKHLKKQYERGEIEIEDVRATMASYNGLMKHCNSFRLRSKLYDTLVFTRKSEPDNDDENGGCE